jgi:pimeloyl-ACP methyl ester carboxylesterase
MDFFRAHQAIGITLPTYFIESTAPYNVDDTAAVAATLPPELQEIDPEQAVRNIAAALVKGADPNLVVMVHGFHNPAPAVLGMYTSAALAIERDPQITTREGLVCVGYRWPSEKMGMPTQGARDALPTLAYWLLFVGVLVVFLSLPLYFIPGAPQWWANWLGRLGEHVFTLIGWTAAGLILMTVLLRIIVYFRDNYRASNFGVPDLIQVIRAIDAEIVRQHGESGVAGPLPRVQLSFIGHSMGGFVVTNAIRTLSDVFAVPVDALNSYGAGSPPQSRPEPPSHAIGNVFELKRFVLASPDIPAETLLSSRGNFLASALSRFDEAYLFSNEGDEVLRQISTLANYFVFPAKSRNHGFRLGNVEILSRNFGMIDVNGEDFLRVLRIGNKTLQELYDSLEDAKTSRHVNNTPVLEQAPLPKRFTYFDCTDYRDYDVPPDPAKPGLGRTERPLLTFAKYRKQYDAEAKLRWYSHLYLLIVYVLNHQRPNVHGGYFEGILSQQLIYRLACLGYDGTVRAYGSEALMGKACEEKQIRMLVSPMLWDSRKTDQVAPPKPVEEKMRPAARAAPRAQQPAAPAGAVPDLVGMPIAAAREIIARMRRNLVGQGAPAAPGQEPQLLLLEITREAKGQAEGAVVSQTPAPNSPLELRTTIEVVIARR